MPERVRELSAALPFQIGAVVAPIAGADIGRPFLVLDFCGDGRVLLSDGRRRRISRPKPKNPRHLRVLSPTTGWCCGTMRQATDKAIRRTLIPFQMYTEPERFPKLERRDSSAKG